MQQTLINSDAILDELAERAASLHQRARDSWIECAYVSLEAREIAGAWAMAAIFTACRYQRTRGAADVAPRPGRSQIRHGVDLGRRDRDA